MNCEHFFLSAVKELLSLYHIKSTIQPSSDNLEELVVVITDTAFGTIRYVGNNTGSVMCYTMGGNYPLYDTECYSNRTMIDCVMLISVWYSMFPTFDNK
ncbi:hypothetical protein EST35_0105 [Pseudomonas phage vB_PaeM_PA5oct]|uniref:Uncharacterized protein n=1 Tax=Pseudomonas phage vB_PaeM_PA5oct TaxID=2163605 RepID=A0A4Y5JTC9_9CAUD|nr:hypothetical protein PQE65_gp378 [Pseudomonas phage vB_PaeM_PA5oct]QCG75987.1 hypothetical protein EST35_0105 [Pseudomonas phage vB_PaeM_PA5oct]